MGLKNNFIYVLRYLLQYILVVGELVVTLRLFFVSSDSSNEQKCCGSSVVTLASVSLIRLLQSLQLGANNELLTKHQ